MFGRDRRFQSQPATRPEARVTTMMTIADLKILVVDDHRIIRRDMEWLLKGMGCEHVHQASNAGEAEKLMTSVRYDLVFLDWNMPVKSGYHLLQQCRADLLYDGVAFVLFSAESDVGFISNALKAGAVTYIVKPVSQTALENAVQAVLAWLELQRGAPDDVPL